jgi:hypothetical protein
MKAMDGIGKPVSKFESPLVVASGECSKTDEEYLQALGAYLKDLFKKPVCEPSILELLDPFHELRSLGDLPTPVEIRTAVRRMRCSAGGIDGLRPEHLKSVSRDNDLFHSRVVKHVHEFWEGEEDGTFRVPKDWEICDTVMLFKSKDATKPENYRSMMKLVVQQKLVLIIIGLRLQRCVDGIGKSMNASKVFAATAVRLTLFSTSACF